MTDVEQIRELEIAACMALKQNQQESAERILKSMFIHVHIAQECDGSESGEMIVAGLKNVLIFAARNRRGDMVEKWLMEVWQNIRPLALYREMGEFINGIAFVIADRQLVGVFPKLEIILKQYLRSAIKNSYRLDGFAREWLSITAEIAFRGLSKSSSFLVRNYLRILYFSDNWQFVFSQLGEYSRHFQVVSQSNGYEKAYQIFGMVDFLRVILMERIAKMPEGLERTMFEWRLLRGMIILVCNVARVTNRCEGDILASWKELAMTGKGLKMRQRFQNLYDAELRYWKETKPGSYHDLGVEN